MEPLNVLAGLLSALNAAFLIYSAWKKLKPEVKKMETENESEALEASNTALQGAKLSGDLLKERIEELKLELDEEKKARKAEIEAEREARKIELDAEREIRKRESEYFKRRLKDAEREARDYRLWAAKLVRQVVDAGKIPVAFIPVSLEDSDPAIANISNEIKEKQAQVSQKWEERKENDK